MEKNTFTYRYSAAQSKEAEAIRKRYVTHEADKLERLRLLDGKVQQAGVAESLCLGVIGVLIFGLAMCFGLGALGSAWWLSFPLGIIGIAVMLPAYPLYRYLYNKKREELTPEILRLSEEIMKK